MDEDEINNLDIDRVHDMFEDKTMQQFFNQLLFWVQNVGSVKNVKGIEVFVKNEYCEENLKDINKFLRSENSEKPTIRRELGKWNFLEESLLPLLVSQKQDKKLSFLTILLLAELTYMPDKKAEHHEELVEKLKSYKHSFLAPEVISTLIEHLAEWLQENNTTGTEKHAQMIELIIVVFKNLLQVRPLNLIFVTLVSVFNIFNRFQGQTQVLTVHSVCFY
jgi:hypothetical protein